MEVSSTGAPAEPPGLAASANHTLKQNSSHFLNHGHHHHQGSFPSKSLVIIIISIFSVVVLLAIFLIILLLKRLKSAKKSNDLYKECNSINHESGSFIAQTAINFNSSPELRGGCLYGGPLGKTQPHRYKAVQIFTYKELEVATTGFSEANVIGRGGFGVVYRGVLNDGTEAAIKMLRRVGKQGERAFRVEIAAIAAMCVQPEAHYRPLMTDVVQSLIPLAKNSSVASPGSSTFQSQRPSPSPTYLTTQMKTG
ncbi:hypothetical protein CsatB_029556 [Cannabis sativa]